ncbi:hypothetical protein B566_EDAN012655, partial [Ephemera danica]
MTVDSDHVVNPYPNMHAHNPFMQISIDEIDTELRSLACNKSTGSDPMPSNVIKQCATELSLPLQKLSSNINNKLQTDVVYLDYEKAFDSVSHILLIEKLSQLN